MKVRVKLKMVKLYVIGHLSRYFLHFKGATYCKEDGTSYPGYMGNDIGSVSNVADPNACQRECRANSECNFWTYNTDGKLCWLKSHHYNSIVACDATSGPKYCP